MAFVIKSEKDIPIDVLTKALFAAVSAEKIAVKLPDDYKRKEQESATDVLGIFTYGINDYEMFTGRQAFGRESVDSIKAFDALEVDEINHIICFAQKQQYDGSSNIKQDINLWPSTECLEFLRNVGDRLRKTLPGVKAMALTYYPALDPEADPKSETEQIRLYEPIL